MTIEKSELKMLLAKDFGQQMEKAQEKAEHAIYENKGMAVGFLRSEVLLNQKTQETKDRLLHGKVELDLTDPIELAKFVVGEMMSVASEIHKRGDEASKAGLQAEGEKKAWGDAAKLLFDVWKEENNKIEAFRAAVAAGRLSQDGDDLVLSDDPGDNGRAGPPPPRVPGMHPGLPLKAKREQAEMLKAQESSEPEESSEGESGDEDEASKGSVKARSKKTSAKSKVGQLRKKVSKQGENGAQDS